MVIDLAFIEHLLEQLEAPIADAHRANLELVREYELLLSEEVGRITENERRNRPIGLDIENALSTGRVARGTAYASLQYVDWYESLAVLDTSTTLARWVVGSEAGTRTVNLVPTLFYPILLNPSGRMGFARVAKTRITYVRSGGSWDSSDAIGSHSYRLSVHMPDAVHDHNLRVVVAPAVAMNRGSVELKLRFSGNSVDLVASSVAGSAEMVVLEGGEWTRRLLDDVHAELVAPRVIQDVARAALRGGFTFERLGVDDHNANRFFPRGLMRLRLIEFDSQPILIASSQ